MKRKKSCKVVLKAIAQKQFYLNETMFDVSTSEVFLLRMNTVVFQKSIMI